MADHSWSSVLRNRADYPDDMTVEIGGNPIALGELRNVVVPKEDFTRVTQGWSERDRSNQSQISLLQNQLATAIAAQNDYEARLKAVNEYETNPAPQPGGGPLIDYERDPILGPIFAASRQALERQSKTEANLDRVEKMLQGIGAQLGQWPVMMALDQIKRNDPYNVDPQQLVQQALQSRQGPPNLNDAYTLLTREQREAAIRKEAETAAYEKAKLELARGQVPFQPFGQPQTMRTPDPTYATLDEAEQAAVMDPEMLAILMGQS